MTPSVSSNPKSEAEKNVEKYLDEQDLERMEFDRAFNDLVPEEFSSQPKLAGKHTDRDPIQKWMRINRR